MNNTLIKKVQYYIGTSYRRKILDEKLNKNRDYFRGSVLDIGGGRKRGAFNPPETEAWIFADITPESNPDVICNVEKMQFKDNSFDTIKATELFEHVEKPEDGIRECFRVLKTGGHFIISAPFLYPIHGDPFDYQRWTQEGWVKNLEKYGFKLEKIEVVGLFFTVLVDMLKKLNIASPFIFRSIGYLFYPFLDLISYIDKTLVHNKQLNKYTTGYFIIAKK